MDFGSVIVVASASVSASWLAAYLFAKKKEGGNKPPKTNPEWGRRKEKK